MQLGSQVRLQSGRGDTCEAYLDGDSAGLRNWVPMGAGGGCGSYFGLRGIGDGWGRGMAGWLLNSWLGARKAAAGPQVYCLLESDSAVKLCWIDV